MPSQQSLDEYYSTVYWGTREGKHYGVNLRGIVHFQILQQFIPDKIRAGRSLLNFGAGHGGLSNLCWLQEMEIINIEPSLLPDFY